MSQLKEEDLKKATSQMTQQLLDAIKEEIQDDIRRYKYASGPRHTKGIEYKRSLRKRNGLKSNFQKRKYSCCQLRHLDTLQQGIELVTNYRWCYHLSWRKMLWWNIDHGPLAILWVNCFTVEFDAIVP